MGLFDWLFGKSKKQLEPEEKQRLERWRQQLQKQDEERKQQLEQTQRAEAKLKQERERQHAVKALEEKARQQQKAADERAKQQREAEQRVKQEAQARREREQEQQRQAQLQAELKAQQEADKQRIRQHRFALQESGTDYAQEIATVLQPVPNFWKLYEHNVLSTMHIPGWDLLNSLNNGTAIIQELQTLSNYVAAYGGHHYFKLITAYNALFPLLPENAKVDILDYGCGQALATLVFYDHMIRSNKNFQVNQITLIEPSKIAVKRGILKLNHFIDYKNHVCAVREVNKALNDLEMSDITTPPDNIKIHLFSNILDVTDFDYTALAEKIKKTQKGINYCICVSPANYTAQNRIVSFQNCFSNTNIPCFSGGLQGKIFRQANKRWIDNHDVTMFQRIFRYNA